MSTLIKREDAIEVVCELVPIRDDAVEIADAIRAIPSAEITHDDVMQYCNPRLLVLATVEFIKHQYRIGFEDGKASADRPSGEVDAVKEYERQVHNLNQGYITLGEFDKRIEPLRHLYYDRPQGEWIDRTTLKGFPEFECSACHAFGQRWMTFCPHCGARMKGADDE